MRVGVPVGIVHARLPTTYFVDPAPETVTADASVSVLDPVVIFPLVNVSALVVPFTLTFPVNDTPDVLLIIRLLKENVGIFLRTACSVEVHGTSSIGIGCSTSCRAESAAIPMVPELARVIVLVPFNDVVRCS